MWEANERALKINYGCVSRVWSAQKVTSHKLRNMCHIISGHRFT